MTENWQLLIVEDDPDGREFLERLLQRYNIDYDVVPHAEQALDMLHRQHYSGMIIDLHLPDMDGWQLLKTIQQDPRITPMPCVAITAYHNSGLPLKAREAGFAAYIPKPLEVKTFVQQLRACF